MLHAPGGEAGPPVALHDQEGDHDRDHRQQRPGDHQVVNGLAAGRERLLIPVVEADGQRVPLRRAQHDQRQEVVVPGGDHGEQQHRDHARRQQPERDLEEGADLAGAVDPRRLEQFGGHRVLRVDPDQVQPERADQGRQDDRPRACWSGGGRRRAGRWAPPARCRAPRPRRARRRRRLAGRGSRTSPARTPPGWPGRWPRPRRRPRTAACSRASGRRCRCRRSAPDGRWPRGRTARRTRGRRC